MLHSERTVTSITRWVVFVFKQITVRYPWYDWHYKTANESEEIFVTFKF